MGGSRLAFAGGGPEPSTSPLVIVPQYTAGGMNSRSVPDVC